MWDPLRPRPTDEVVAGAAAPLALVDDEPTGDAARVAAPAVGVPLTPPELLAALGGGGLVADNNAAALAMKEVAVPPCGSAGNVTSTKCVRSR